MKQEETKDAGTASASTDGLERIDPEFLRLIEISLDMMTDYARNRHAEQMEALGHPRNNGWLKAMAADIERAELRLDEISAWFDGLRSNAAMRRGESEA